MEIPFTKYQGTGNDFVMIDQREKRYLNITDIKLVQQLCDRRFGIGADGLILLESSNKADFKMVYFNADGNESTMCGNGGRCIVHFAHSLNIFDTTCSFEAIDGRHTAFIKDGWVHLQMMDVEEVDQNENVFILDTGSPHYVHMEGESEDLEIVNFGRKIRYNETFAFEGINVNLVKKVKSGIEVRTYERGVEDETLSCGTGAVASVLSAHIFLDLKSPQEVKVKGGKLLVSFEKAEKGYTNIYLSGPAERVFSGKIDLTV